MIDVPVPAPVVPVSVAYAQLNWSDWLGSALFVSREFLEKRFVHFKRNFQSFHILQNISQIDK